jgi:hypothetical protein
MSQVGLQTLRDTFGKARMHATSPARVGGELGGRRFGCTRAHLTKCHTWVSILTTNILNPHRPCGPHAGLDGHD